MVVVSPLEVARTRLQVQRIIPGQVPHYRGTKGTIQTILREEGIRGLYRGVNVNIMALVPNWMIYFASYSQLKAVASELGYKEGPLVHVHAAIGANVVTALGTTPFWVIKTRLQTQHALRQLSLMGAMEPGSINSHSTAKYHSTLHAFRTVAREEGVRALWSGLVPQLVGSVNVAIQFPLYEWLKQQARSRALAQGVKREPNAVELVAASALSKIVATTAAYPHEVIRSRLQSQRSEDPKSYKGMLDAVRTIYRMEGVRGFYQGLSTTVVRAVPSCAITFTLYEIIQRNFHAAFGV